jgi:V/A-type H+-transporting ATPase subunit I
MFKPHGMKKVIMAGSRDILETTIDTLFDLRILHIKDFDQEDPDFKMGAPLSEAGPASEKLLKLRGASKVLEVKAEAFSEFTETDKRMTVETIDKKLEDMIADIDRNISRKWDDRSSYEGELRDIDRNMEELLPFQEFPLKLEDYEPYKSLAVLTGNVRGDPREDLYKVTRDQEIFINSVKEGNLIVVFVSKDLKEEVSKVLVNYGFVDVRPPKGTGYVENQIRQFQEEKKSLEEKMRNIDEDIKSLQKDHAQFLLASEEHLRFIVEKAEMPLRCAMAPNSFVIEGFLPEVAIERLKERLSKETDDRIYIEVLDPEKGEDIPVAMDNPKQAKSFEVLTDLIARPKYKEIDPTILMWLGLPLFFGIMLGDLGYGIVILVCVYLGVFTKLFNFLGMSGATKQLNSILLWCGLWTLVFGFIFNEFFGVELFTHPEIHHDAYVLFPNITYPLQTTIPRFLVFGPTYLPIIRFDNILPLLKTCIWIGLAHVFLGFVIGFRNMYVKHGFKHALCEKGSWLLIMIGGVITFYFILREVGGYVHLSYHETAVAIGMIILIVGCILLIIGEGPIGLVHLPGIISNTMSYARILAIGLSSAGIALAFNNMGIGMLSGGPGNFIFGCFILFIGHFINTLLGILGPGLHSLRLHYVEFFVKFYEGGGTHYSPFGNVRRFTRNTKKAVTGK